MDFLTKQNKICEGDSVETTGQISAKGKNVVVIGGGDTGSDCIGTSNNKSKICYSTRNLRKTSC